MKEERMARPATRLSAISQYQPVSASIGQLSDNATALALCSLANRR